MSFSDIISFFLYVIPGFISTEIYRAKYPAKKTSDFIHITWSISVSILIITIARLLECYLKWGLFPTAKISFPRIRTIAVLIGLSVIIALVRILRKELAEKYNLFGFLKIKPLAIWPKVNNSKITEWAYITLSNGSKYLGWISEWTYDPNETEQDFLLSDAKKLDENFNTLYEIDGQGVYLKTSQVISIEFFKGQTRSEEEFILEQEAASTKDKN